jgi:hypothetical protein
MLFAGLAMPAGSCNSLIYLAIEGYISVDKRAYLQMLENKRVDGAMRQRATSVACRDQSAARL